MSRSRSISSACNAFQRCLNTRPYTTSSLPSIARLKNPPRGGQNLTDRYSRLERTLRGKQALAQEKEDILETLPKSTPSLSTKPLVETFHGFTVPKKPRPVDSDECCMSGCAICVYDLYEDSLETYEESVAALRANLSSRAIPESEWPESIREDTLKTERLKDVALSVFEQMEQKLKAKRELSTAPSKGRPKGRPRRKTNLQEIYDFLGWLLFPSR